LSIYKTELLEQDIIEKARQTKRLHAKPPLLLLKPRGRLCAYTNESQKAKSLHEAVKGSDCLTIITDYTEFKNLNLKQIKALMNEKQSHLETNKTTIKPCVR